MIYKNYTQLYGLTQEQIYFKMIQLGYNEDKIQALYKIPQASLRRCRYKMKKGVI